MLNKPSNTGISRVLALAVTLLGLLAVLVLATSVAFAQTSSDVIEYKENGDGAVRTFTSTDPEGAGIDWDVTGIDADDFTIDSRGVLTFKSPPDFESPTDRVHGTLDFNGDGDPDDPAD